MKDLVEHIRTVHFSLLVICLVLFAAAFEQKKGALLRAEEDARAIRELARNKESVLKTIEQKADDLAGAQDKRYYRIILPASLTNQSPGSPRYGYFEESQRWLYFAAPTQETAAEHVGQYSFNGTDVVNTSTPWNSISDFFAFWDQDNVFLKRPQITAGGNPPACAAPEQVATVTNGPADQQGQLDYTPLGADRSQIVPGFRWGSLQFCSFLGQPSNRLPVSVRQILNQMAEAAGYKTSWGSGSSKEEFVDLIANSKNSEKSPIQDLVAGLHEKATEDTDKIEMFGAKIPASQIAIFGSLILIACQFYLLIHLGHLRQLLKDKRAAESRSAHTSRQAPQNEDAKEPLSGYIALYKDLSSKVFSWVSVGLFPVGALLFTALHCRGEHSLACVVPVASVFVSLLIAFQTLNMFRRIHAMI